MEKVREIVREGRRVGKEDPRRVVHAFKVGLALALVSSFYYYQPLYDNFGVNAMWAVMTVVVVFEFSVGATLGKGLNRAVATLVAGGLGIGAHHLASLSGPTVEPILLAIFVFVLAALSTFVRFFPRVKARYDYGVLIFILTFALISVSGFREDEILDLAHKRLSTVIMGGVSCVLISIFVCPVWAGQDLHSLLASNFDTLSHFLQEFGDEYFEATEDGDIKEVEKRRRNLERYKSVLNSKSNEEALANFAKWEPRHGQFRFRHPWRQYLAVGALLRQSAYRIDALNSNINSDMQIPMDIKKKIEEPLRRMSSESGKSMKEVSISLKNMTISSSFDIHVVNSQSACKTLSTLLKSGILNDVEPLQMISLMTTVSLLIDIVNLTEKISESVHELASAAKFKNKKKPSKSNSGSIGQAMPNKSHDDDDHVVTILGDVDTSNNVDQSQSHGEISVDSCHHVTIKINDDDSIHDKNEDGDIHVHTNRVSCDHTNASDLLDSGVKKN
ncbi:Aluminum-activated malate transporter [Arabidopsis suecica]|uniref:Aluminum-activated malate transporter 2 n=2 Tax=Arabidopsis TaxID=3701 RepID=ALMT2_ARATH|nr:aluminum activated malate transporter family protein [Arabidopsis thaliana]Q9SJE8.2 RecName: Full=Aluminum-activated malate transporter 2; Short=AtALMT2 [Arabidopsis thaliana]AEE28290.1 aluminum activated malate transporter family protein [Arabidopsis thaliana]KAG7596293.1 Aluminum-activated malate transporter [Arabidopsis suecica]|eukprot:NP_172320.1 aluminum activated malate transporter family protein [Arabidopsis thaliana]